MYKSRNKIYLSIKNIKIERSLKKLNDKMLNFHFIKKSTQNNVRLKLLDFMKIHDTFYTLLMKSIVKNFLF